MSQWMRRHGRQAHQQRSTDEQRLRRNARARERRRGRLDQAKRQMGKTERATRQQRNQLGIGVEAWKAGSARGRCFLDRPGGEEG